MERSHDHTRAAHAPEASSLGQPRDPVCGLAVSRDTPYRLTHADAEHYFCSAGCLEKYRVELAREP